MSRAHRPHRATAVVRTAVACVVAALGGLVTSAAPATAASPTAAVPATIAAALAAPAAIEPDPFGEYAPILLVMDTSGSMADFIDRPDGLERQPRIDAARSAALDLITALRPTSDFGLIAYPGRDAQTVDGCSIGRLELPLGPLDLPVASAAVRRLEPDSGTPTGPALSHAAEELRRTYGEHTDAVIVLVSDGGSNCGTPPCEVADSIRASGLEVQVNTVGLHLTGRAEDEMRCVAGATGGTYVDVGDGDDIGEAITKAAGAALTLTVDVPEDLTVVTGTGSAGGGDVTVTVRSTGRLPAADVRVSLMIESSADGPGSVLVPRPVRFLGNIATGSSRTVSFTVRPDDASGATDVRWTVAAIGDNTAPVIVQGDTSVVDTLDPDRLGGVLAGTERVVVLGDSYSSGEGAGSYLAGTDGDGGSRCHRSNATHAAALWGADATTIIACSGAVTGNLFGPQSSGVRVRPQLLQLRDHVLGENPPDAVVLSIGGNDAGFSSVATRCLLTPRCESQLMLHDGSVHLGTSAMLQRAMDVRADVASALRAVDAAVNDATAMEHRGGGEIPVVLLPYPRLLPPTPGAALAPTGCMLGFGADEADAVNDYVDALNVAVSNAAYSLRNEGRPVYVVPDVVDAFQPDHTICEGKGAAYANFVAMDTYVKDRPVERLLFEQVELLHPNAEGYAAVARAVAGWSHSRAAEPIAVEGTPVWDPRVVRRAVTPLERTLQNPTLLGEVGTQANGPLYVAAEGYAPGTGVTIRLDSVPRTLDTAVADDDGRVRTWVRVPPETGPGLHHAVVLGVDPEGQDVAAVTPVRVLPQGGPWLVVLVVVGALLLAGAAVVLVRTPRSRPR